MDLSNLIDEKVFYGPKSLPKYYEKGLSVPIVVYSYPDGWVSAIYDFKNQEFVTVDGDNPSVLLWTYDPVWAHMQRCIEDEANDNTIKISIISLLPVGHCASHLIHPLTKLCGS